MIRAKDTPKGFNDMPFPHIVSGHSFVIREKPQENMDFGGHIKFPHRWDENWLYPSEVDHMV